jgi:hypothetical protein
VGKEHLELQYWMQIGLCWVQKYYKWMDDTNAYVITMSRSLFSDYTVTEGLSGMCCIEKSFVRESVCPRWDKQFVFF